MEGHFLETVVGLSGAKTSVALVGLPNSQVELELIKYHFPKDPHKHPLSTANTLGIRHLAFIVDDIEAIVDGLKKKGIEPFGEIQNYEDRYKLCYVRGPEGIILELAEELE